MRFFHSVRRLSSYSKKKKIKGKTKKKNTLPLVDSCWETHMCLPALHTVTGRLISKLTAETLVWVYPSAATKDKQPCK